MLAYEASSFLPLGLNTKLTSGDLVHRIHALQPEGKIVTDAKTGVTVGVTFPNSSNFSIEPGGQFEFSSSPKASLEEVSIETAEALKLMEEAAQGEIILVLRRFLCSLLP